MMSTPIEARMPKTSRSLTVTLAVAFLAMSASVLIIASSLQTFFNFETQRAIVASKQQLIAREVATTVASFIQEKFSVLTAAVRLGIAIDASPEEQKQVLDSLLGLEPTFRQLVLLDAQGQELAKTSRLSQMASGQLTDRMGSDLLAQTSQGSKYVGSVYIDDVTSEPLVIMAVPVTNIFGDFQGTLMAEANLKFMWDLVDRLEVGKTGRAYVVDRRGNLIAFGDISRVLRGENVSNLNKVSEFINSPAPIDETGAGSFKGITGATVIGAYAPLGTPDWAVVTELPVSEAYKEVIRGGMISLAVIVVVGTLAGLMGAYMARRLAAPLLGLTETATRIASGEMGLQVAYEGPAEVVNLAQAFNSMTSQLQELIGSLEQRVADRTRNLQAAVDVSHATTSILDPDELLRQTVDLVRERFDLYYVGLFLVDEDRRFAVLHAGTGEAGQQMLARGHQLEIGGDSMIGQCIARDEARIALDVGEEAIRFDNPFLPHTHSEMALPLRSRGRVIGAMSVQSTIVAAFDESDIAVMQTMADQVAVAIENAHLFADTERLFAESQAALEEVEATHRRYLGQAWTEYVHSSTLSGYRYSKEQEQFEARIAPLGAEIFPEVRQAMTRQRPIVVGKDNGDTADHVEESSSPTLVAPIMLRGQPIGALGLRRVKGDQQWSTDDVALSEAIAEQFALTADNLRLLDETQRRAAREHLIGGVTARIRETLDLDTVLRTAISEIGDALGLARVEVRVKEDSS
jgi:GAF domain-containing protein/HAMP domain-containing protein